MNIILLSGGSGKRLWPLSNDIRSKQFLKIFRKAAPADSAQAAKDAAAPTGSETGADGIAADAYESMAQRMYANIRRIDPEARVIIATSKSQVSEIHNQLGDDVNVSVEPCRRDTFPAIALASAYLHDVLGVGEDEPVVACPVDPYVEDDYFIALQRLSDLTDAAKTDAAGALSSACHLTLLGIEPTYPSEKYGYILPETRDEVSRVRTFKEKPDVQTAREYIREGALWNGGIFAYRLGYVLEKAHALMPFEDYADLFARYAECPKISFDYAVVEKEPAIQVLRFHGLWKDLGTWNTLTEAMSENVIGRAQMNETCSNTHIINDLDIPILAMGIHNAVIAASPDGILVSDKEQSSYIKPYVDKMEQPVMFAEKSWGSFQVLDVEKDSMTIKVTLLPGHGMNYHSHDHRDEVWTVISGNGRTIVDGMEQKVGPGDVITMQAGCRHTVIAETPLQLIEVQLGHDISRADKHKYRLEV